MEVPMKPLLTLSAIETLPKFLQSIQESGKFVKKLRETDPDLVNCALNRSDKSEDHRTLQAGLLYLALTELDRQPSACTEIVLTTHDSLNYVLSEAARLVAEYWTKMSPNVRGNLLCLLTELIAARANVEVLMLHLCRRMNNGDMSADNIWLIDNMLQILERNKEWLVSADRHPTLLPLIVFTLLRLIPDHYISSASRLTGDTTHSVQLQSTISSLRSRELILCEDIIRNNFDKCAPGGRDFIRLLHGVARLHPMKKLWEDLLNDFSSISLQYSSIADILEITTPPYLTVACIPQEMEQWTVWIFRNVHCIPTMPIKRYEDFFQRKFLSNPDNHALRVHFIRYVVTAFYPDNDMLASTLIPRWNLISWIMSQCTCPVAAANAKLALFYDWLFFKQGDCIMNLEPALLLIMNHLGQRSQSMAFALVEFMVKIAGAYNLAGTNRIAAGFRNGLEEMIRLGVVRTINPLWEILHRTSRDLFHAFRTLLGVDPFAVPPVSPAAEPTTPDSNRGKSDADANLSAPARRPSTPPLGGSKPKTSGSEGVSLLDPRLTRGHAAVLAGAVSSAPTDANNIRPVNATPVVAQAIPASIISSSSTQLEDTNIKTLRASAPSLSIPTSLQSKLILPSPPPDSLLSKLDLEILDDSRDSDFRSSKADWSPPPLPPCQTLNRLKNDGLPETSESLELKIDNLRRRFQEYHLRYHYSVEPVDVNALLEQLDGPVRDALEKFRDLAVRLELIRSVDGVLCADRIGSCEKDDLTQIADADSGQHTQSVRLRSASVLGDLCDAMELLVQAVLAEDNFDDLEVAGRTAAVVCELLFPLFAERLMPAGTEWTEEQLEDCLSFPIFVPFRHLWQMNPGDPKRELLLLLLTEMQARQPRLGYHLLFYLKVGKLNDEKMTTYRSFCASQENPNLRSSLYKDMQLLADDNRRLFAYLLPDIYTGFSTELANDIEFLHLIVGSLDPTMCNTLVSEIVRGHLNLFPSNDLSELLKASLSWNSIEQFFFWQLINAHEIPTRSFLPLVKYVNPPKHPEACANLILLFKLERPNFELIRALLARPDPNDDLAITALHFWSCPDNQHSTRFANILRTMIMNSLSPRADSNARDARDKKRNGPKPSQPAENHVELSSILTHLDGIRRNCRNISLLQDEDIQYALQEVAKSDKVALSIKDHFSDLLALAEDRPAPPSSQSSRNSDSSDATPQRLSSSGKSGKSSGPGSKGGHSLRNLDSRRAAEAERRQLPQPGKRASRLANNLANKDDDSDTNEDQEPILLSSSSTSSDDEDDRDPPMVLTRKKRNTSPQPASKSSKRVSEPSQKDRRTSSKRTLLSKSDDEDEEVDDEEKSLEVVMNDDSGDEKSEERIRPPKRRKIAGRRSLLDD